MRGKSHTHGGSLADARVNHATSFPDVLRRCTESPADGGGSRLPPDVGPPGEVGPHLVDGARLIVVPGRRGGVGGTVMFLHGAGTGTTTPLFNRLGELLVAAGVDVARLEMPYRVAGRRAPDRPARLDSVLSAAVARLGLAPPHSASPRRGTAARPVALAGASMGARVACRTAHAVGAVGVLALGFPLSPPGGRPSRRPSEAGGIIGGASRRRSEASRQGELDGAGVPVLVVQGERDAFGMPRPDPARRIELYVVTGADHSFRTRRVDGRTAEDAVAEAASTGGAWLLRQVARG
jgi:uncharacterized protein